jgi:hypothetical protein
LVRRNIFFVFCLGTEVALCVCRNWEAYELMPNQEVCDAKAVTEYLGSIQCVSPCTFLPKVESNHMVCAIEDDVDLVNVKPGPPYPAEGDLGVLYTWCSDRFRVVLNVHSLVICHVPIDRFR